MIHAAKAEGLRDRAASRGLPPRRAAAAGGGGAAALLRSRPSTRVLADVDTLRAKYAGDPDVVIGVAPHSVRAVPPEWLARSRRTRAARAPASHARRRAAARDRRVRRRDRQAAAGAPRRRGAALPRGSPRCTPPTSSRTRRAPRRRAGFACVCATTERDLGDGLPDVGALARGGGAALHGHRQPRHYGPHRGACARSRRHERLRTETRMTWQPPAGTLAEALWREGSIETAAACGFADAGGGSGDRARSPLAGAGRGGQPRQRDRLQRGRFAREPGRARS